MNNPYIPLLIMKTVFTRALLILGDIGDTTIGTKVISYRALANVSPPKVTTPKKLFQRPSHQPVQHFNPMGC
jgi:hypothetical protein